MYTAVVLDADSVWQLKTRFPAPEGWTGKYHHMTVNMGPPESGPALDFLGNTVELTVISVASDPLVYAVGVECEVPSTNARKHITLAVNEAAGGKAKMSNKLSDWKAAGPLRLRGTVQVVQ